MHHPDAFADLAQAFDPAANANYAARFLSELFRQTGTWPKAAAMYHSATPELAADYQRKVMTLWPEGEDVRAAIARPAFATASAGTASQAGPFASRHALTGRIIPLAAHPTQEGRGLASYREAPVMLQTMRGSPAERFTSRPRG